MASVPAVLALLNTAGIKSLVAALVFTAPPLHMFFQLRGAYALGFGSTLAPLCISGTVFALYLLLILMMSVSG